MKKRLLATILTLCMVLTLLPVTALAVSYDVYVGGILMEDNYYLANGESAVTDAKPASGGYAFYNDGTLTLHDASIAGIATGTSDEGLAGIYAKGDLEIILEGSSSVTGQAATYSYGVYADDNLSISGTGSLTVNGGDADYSYGLYSEYETVTISSGNVTANGGTAADISCGIYAYENIVINGGTVTAVGGEADISCGLYAYEDVAILGGEVVADGGIGTSESHGIYTESGSININRGQVEATGGEADDISCGIYASYDDVNISGGTVAANGGEADASAGICASIHLVIKGGSVTAGGSATDSGIGYGLWAKYGDVLVSGDQITASGGQNGDESYGIFADSGNVALCGRTLSLAGKNSSIYTVALAYQAGLLTSIVDVVADVIIKGTPSGVNTVHPVKTSDGLDVEQGNVVAWWDYRQIDGESGISYGSDMDHPTDFLPFSGGLVTGSVFVRNIELKSGEYLPNGENIVTTAEPAVGYAHYENGVLTLHDAQISATNDVSGILTRYDLSMVLEGRNTVESGNGDTVCGIFVTGDISISGGGSLNVTGGEDRSTAAGESCAMYAYNGGVTVNSGEITAQGGVSSSFGYGIRARGDININGGTVNATGGTVECLNGIIMLPGMPIVDLNEGIGYSYGIYSAEGSLNVTGGDVTAAGGPTNGLNCKSYGIRADDFNISGGKTQAAGGQANHSSYGVYAFYDVNISGGEIIAGSADYCQRGSYAIFAEDNISVSDGVVHALGGGNAEIYSSGLHSEYGKIYISGGQVEAEGGAYSGYSYGIHAIGGMDISGSAKVTAAGGDDGYASCGVNTYGGFSAADQAELTAAGGTANSHSSFGIETNDGVNISGKAKVSAVSSSAPNFSYGITTNRITMNGGTLNAASGAASDSMGLSAFYGASFNGGNAAIRGEGLALRVTWGDLRIADVLTLQGASTSNGVLGEAAIYTDGNSRTVRLGADASGDEAKYVSITSPSVPDSGSSGPSYSYYTITATAGAGGAISPNGAVSVREGQNKVFAITANEGYVIRDVLVDGVSVGAVSEYTFEKAQKSHTIEAIFEWDNPFEDVLPGDWFYENVRYVYERGLMVGTADDTFSPELEATRAMVVTILWRLEGSPVLADYDSGFTDLKQDWYIDAVNWAHESGVVEGYDDEHFGPDDSITREQLVTVLWRYAVDKGLDVSVGEDTNILSYHDAFDVSEWAIGAFQWACGAGIIEGDNGNLLPGDYATRAQLAAVLQRFIEWTKE